MPTSSGEDVAWLSLPARRESLDAFRNFVMTMAQSVPLASAVMSKLDLVLEEVLLNVMDYAYAPGRERTMDVGCGMLNDEFFQILVQDQGRPFNPLKQPPPDLTADIDNRMLGGLGVFLTKKMADQLQYRYERGRNILEIGFRLQQPTSAKGDA